MTTSNPDSHPIRRLPIGVALVTLVAAGAGLWRWIRSAEALERSELLTYPDAVDYFVRHRPASEEHLRGALLRQKRGRFWLVSFRFLDEAGGVCVEAGKEHGRQVLVRDMDEELAEIFGDKDLVLFE